MIVNTLAKTLSTPKEQDIEMPPVHEKGGFCGRELDFELPVHDFGGFRGWERNFVLPVHEKGGFRGWEVGIAGRHSTES